MEDFIPSHSSIASTLEVLGEGSGDILSLGLSGWGGFLPPVREEAASSCSFSGLKAQKTSELYRPARSINLWWPITPLSVLLLDHVVRPPADASPAALPLALLYQCCHFSFWCTLTSILSRRLQRLTHSPLRSSTVRDLSVAYLSLKFGTTLVISLLPPLCQQHILLRALELLRR